MPNKTLKHADFGRLIARIFNAPGELISRSLEIVGSTLFDWRRSPGIIRWLGGIFRGSFSISAAIIKSLFEIIGGFISGVFMLVLGLLSWNITTMNLGLKHFLFPDFGGIVVIVGKILSLIQSIFWIQAFDRPLSKEEKELLSKVYQSSIQLNIIRIVEGRSGLFDLTPRAFTLGNTLYLKTSEFDPDLLVHEATHSWQYQHLGSRYTIDALTAQWFVEDAYNWQKEIEDRGKTRWIDLNMESQAAFIEHLWLLGKLVNNKHYTIKAGKGSFYEADSQLLFGEFFSHGKSYTLIANKAVDSIRRSLF